MPAANGSKRPTTSRLPDPQNDVGICPVVPVLALIGSGCAASLPPSTRSPQPGVSANLLVGTARERGPFLYVNGSYISQYRLGSSIPVRSIPAPLGLSRTIGLDAVDNLFSQNVNPSWGTMTVYDARTLSLKKTYEGIENIGSFAFDRSNYVYAGGCSRIGVFKPGGGKGLYRVIGHGARSVCSIVADRAGNLYAGNAYGRSVSIYKPGSGEDIRSSSAGSLVDSTIHLLCC